jgi:hypothetical protein
MSMPFRQQKQPFDPVSPVDIVSGGNRGQQSVGFTDLSEKKAPSISTRSSRTGSSSSSSSSLKVGRTARFAEATTVNSPISGPTENRSPFADPPAMAAQQAQPSDVGFGYISNEPVQQHATLQPNMNAPLKSALKTPGTPGRMLNPLSPTFREEQILEKHEEETEREQVKDLVCLPSSRQSPVNANSFLESQNSGANGQNDAPWCQLLLLFDCPRPHRHHLHHF